MEKRNPAKRGPVAAELPMQSRGEIPTDVLGSYTGVSRTGDRPVQDADDL